jgi:transcriptional regulator with XRE-family HTH domain
MPGFEFFPENLIQLRTGLGLTQAGLGQSIAGGAAVISRLENGLRPTQRQVEALAQALGVSPEALMGGPCAVQQSPAPAARINAAAHRRRRPTTPMSFPALLSEAIAEYGGSAVVVMLPPSHFAYVTPNADAAHPGPTAARIPTGRRGAAGVARDRGQGDAAVPGGAESRDVRVTDAGEKHAGRSTRARTGGRRG